MITQANKIIADIDLEEGIAQALQESAAAGDLSAAERALADADGIGMTRPVVAAVRAEVGWRSQCDHSMGASLARRGRGARRGGVEEPVRP